MGKQLASAAERVVRLIPARFLRSLVWLLFLSCVVMGWYCWSKMVENAGLKAEQVYLHQTIDELKEAMRDVANRERYGQPR